jgi:hypothetical protein
MMTSIFCYFTYTPNRLPTKKATTAAIPPIIKVFKPDLTGDLLTTFPFTRPIEKKEIAVNIIE